MVTHKVSEREKKIPAERSSDTRGYDTRKGQASERSGPLGAQESRDEGNLSGGREEVFDQSQTSRGIAQGPGQPQKPIEVSGESGLTGKTPGVPEGMSGMENVRKADVGGGGREYHGVPTDISDIGSKRGARKKQDKK